MPFADKVVHVTLSGQMLNGAEEWQTGFYVGLSEGTAPVPTQAFTDAVRDAWQTFFTSADSFISNSYSFTQVKAARLGVDGKYDGTDVPVSFPTTPKWGAWGAGTLPPQVALVATLIGGSGKGLGGKGRMYLPGVSNGVDANGKIPGINVGKIATGIAVFLDAVNASFDSPGVVINASKGHEKLAGIGARNVPVNGVRVGDVYDTQRRRRNSLSETYQTADLASN